MKRFGGRSTAILGVIVLIAVLAAPAGADTTISPADTPLTTPTITAPTDGATVSGDVSVTATSTAPMVQFYLDDVAFGAPVAVDTGTATTDWPTWGTVNGSYTWTAADCDTECNPTVSTPVTVTLANTPPTVTAPLDAATVSGDVSVTATSTAPMVQFYLDDVAFGAPVAVDTGTATTDWPTWGTADGSYTWTAADCDTECNPTVSTPVTVTLANTPPTVTAPLDAATVSGDVSVTATSTAPMVQFYLDDVAFGAPVAVDTGTATTDWPTWGTADGSYTWTAADCDTECNPTVSTPVTVTLANTPPTVTAPLDGATTSTDVTIEGDSSGGGLAFFLDGDQVGFVGAAPYSLPLTIAQTGAHAVYVQQCDASGVACAGPMSAITNFTVATLHPTITSVSPNPFSPHHDGRDDQTAFRIHLPDTEFVTFSIRNSNGTIVAGPHTPGTLGAGDHIAHWDGKTNSGKVAGDGIFTMRVDTTRSVGGATLHGKTTATVRVDDTASRFSGITGNGFTFYPVADGYLDKFSPKVTVNEGGGLWLEIYNSTGTKVRELAHPHATKGTFQFAWDGRNAAGHMLRAGTFRYFFKAQDAAGNRAISGNYQLHLRHEHLVNRTATLLRNGNQASAFVLPEACTKASYSQSGFASGVWLTNVCDPSFDGFQASIAEYTVSAPGAKRYNTIRIRSYGNTITPPEVVAAIIYNWSTGWKPFGGAPIGKFGANAWANYGTHSAAGFVSGGHAIRIGIGIGDNPPIEDYDLGRVEITVSYSVLG